MNQSRRSTLDHRSIPHKLMLKATILQPDLVLGDTILTLNVDLLKHYNIRGLILDVDETLVPIGSSEASTELKQWVEKIRPELSLWLVSNNISQSRISSIAQSLDVPYILGAGKPSRRKLKQAARAMNLPFEQIAMVGDRLFTDVLAGNRLGLFTILVEPMIDLSATGTYWIRNFEVWLSEIFGVSIVAAQHNFTQPQSSSNDEI